MYPYVRILVAINARRIETAICDLFQIFFWDKERLGRSKLNK